MIRSRTVAVVLLAVALPAAGCVGTETGTPTGHSGVDPPAATPGPVTPTATPGTDAPATTPLPRGDVDVPDGPVAPPERPATLNRSAVREYVGAVEYSIAHNSLWINDYTEVTLACRVDRVSERPWGYEAVVTCTGHSNTVVPEHATATPGPHADWFTQSSRYRVSENATHRGSVTPRDPVS